jgi:hypothetical protein
MAAVPRRLPLDVSGGGKRGLRQAKKGKILKPNQLDERSQQQQDEADQGKPPHHHAFGFSGKKPDNQGHSEHQQCQFENHCDDYGRSN